jgi:pimeloyl-ACP methyl ester carboxylesterase
MLGRVRTRVASVRTRLGPPPQPPAAPPEPLRPALDSAARIPSLPQRPGAPFSRELVTGTYQFGVEIEGRLYNFVLYPGTGDALCVHFSAFFGDWGDRAEYHSQFKGYFHRLRMFWPLREHAFLFLCDTFGADRNGTYYKGEDNDFFVERATEAIIEGVRSELGTPRDRVVTMGSSMGATAAVRLALKHQLAGAVAVAPHLDLDLCARDQGRQRHVAAIVGVENVEDPALHPVTREVRRLAATVPTGPRLVVQSAENDHGVHFEQVEPLVNLWRGRGGRVMTDFHPYGGHTSDRATPEFFRSAIGWCLDR